MTRVREQTESVRPYAPDAPRAAAILAGLGVATPEVCESQHVIAEQFAHLWQLDRAGRSRWRRIVEGSAIDTRRAVIPIEDVPGLSTAQRMRLYERHAPDLAESAARAAIDNAGIDPAIITDLIIVTCTGFSAPGVDVELVQRLGLERSVRRVTVGFMGCFGAITGLRTALGACSSAPDAVALVVCVELCSLHLRDSADVQNQVASALFADGAAAALMMMKPHAMTPARHHHHHHHHHLTITHPGRTALLADRRDDMSWRITDAGFAMTLSPRVPAALRASLTGFVEKLTPAPASVAIHPGGAAILDASEQALPSAFHDDILDARAVMREFGNMSSPSVLFVLQRLLARSVPLPITLLAFGPGLTIESITLQ